MKHSFLQKAAAAALFVLLTAALLAAADFLLVDNVHSYSRVMLQELYRDAGNIDTLFLGSSHCYRSVDPAAVDAPTALTPGRPSSCRTAPTICSKKPLRRTT